MRKVTRDARYALLHEKNYSSHNTWVRGNELILHSTVIVERDGLQFVLRTGGWNTPTTRDRLKAFARSCYTVKGELHLNGEPWDGRDVRVDLHGDFVG